MAQVARVSRPARLIDKDLARLLGFWRAVSELEAEWPEWDELSRLNVIHTWPIEQQTLRRVVDASAAGRLDERQQRDWQELQQLIETHRATVEGMLEGPI
jgi:hypothetical protein